MGFRLQVGQLHELLAPHLLRRVKKDVLQQLPPKMEQMVRVELSPLQREWYRRLLTKNYTTLQSKGSGQVQAGRHDFGMQLHAIDCLTFHRYPASASM